MSDKKTISKERFDKEAANYDQSARFELVRSRYRFVIEEIQKHQFKTWLDVGCGTGALLSVIGEQRKDAQLFGVDLSEEMIKVATVKLGEKANLKVSDSERLPFEDRKFDLISCTFSFHHYPHPVEALIEMKRVLSQDGMLVMADIVIVDGLRKWFDGRGPSADRRFRLRCGDKMRLGLAEAMTEQQSSLAIRA